MADLHLHAAYELSHDPAKKKEHVDMPIRTKAREESGCVCLGGFVLVLKTFSNLEENIRTKILKRPVKK